MRVLKSAVRASDGIAIGRAFVVRRGATAAYVQGSVEQECERFQAALQASREQLSALQAGNAIFAAHLEMMEDPMVADTVGELIGEGRAATDALRAAQKQIEQMFEQIDDEYLRERADDVKDVFDRIHANLTGGAQNPFERLKSGDIVVAQSLAPSDTALANLQLVAAFVTATGSTTSHVCIIARNCRIPAVVAMADVATIVDGDTLIVDGAEGTVIVNPDAATLKEYTLRRQQAIAQAVADCDFAHTVLHAPDGSSLSVMANAGSVAEVEVAIASGADGIGLLRSEFLFLDCDREPSEEQQTAAYMAAARACGTLPLTVRTLDAGGDKQIPYLDIPHEENPFLGWRAIRISLQRKEMFCRQLRSVLRASAVGNVRVMLPMIADVEELRQARELLEQCKTFLAQRGEPFDEHIKLGVMIETPAAVLTADLLAAECDFFSIGTNDLTQYVMAADRGNGRVAALCNPRREAVMRAIAATIAAADKAGIECGMCGEFASDATATADLLRMGLREFSVGSSSVGRLKRTIADLCITR